MERSKLEFVFPLEEIPYPRELTLIHTAPEEVEEMVGKLREDCLTIHPVEGPVERGDFVLLEPREGGGIRLVNTARPMGTAALAGACLGRRTGEAVGDAYRIAGIRRRVLPVFDDALVRSAGLPEVRTTAQYRACCLEELRSRKRKQNCEDLARLLKEEWLRCCRFRLEEGELEETAAELERTVRFCAGDMGRSREEVLAMLAEILEVKADAPSVRQCAETLMRRTLLGERLLEKYGVRLDRARYRRALEKLAEREDGLPEKMSRSYPYCMFRQEKAAIQIDAEVKKYIKSNIQFHCA